MHWVQPARFLYAMVVGHVRFTGHAGILVCVCAASTQLLAFTDHEKEGEALGF